MLAFFESPSSISLSSDITYSRLITRYEFKCKTLETIDLVCLGIFALDAIVKVFKNNSIKSVNISTKTLCIYPRAI